MLHGRNPTHNTEDCRTLKSYAKKKKQDNPNHTKTKTSKAEYHAIAKEVVKCLKTKKKKNKKRQEDVAAEEELNAIGNISISDFDDNNMSTDSDDLDNSSI